MIEVKLDTSFAEAALEALQDRLTDLRPVMHRVGGELANSTMDRFPTGKAPDGTSWAPKSPVTLERYGSRKSNRIDIRPLFGPTGVLSSQITHEPAVDGVSWGSNLIYAAVMQYGAAQGAFGNASNGSPIPWGDIPARPFIGLSDTDRQGVIATVAEWLEGAAK
jgi:phage virion morphogenesis protein